MQLIKNNATSSNMKELSAAF
ncbi:hypothetical protein SBDP1_300037 [Syntrophobacter sp. SbD1]|nr:hypothetical protein SBDP1_300037 [Syntrophobacter sp. SbD1]